MLMRKIVDNGTRLKNGEAALSEKAKELVFRGRYISAGPFLAVEASESSVPNDAAPYQLKIIRMSWLQLLGRNVKHVRTVASDKPLDDVAEEMKNPAVIHRLNKVEKYASCTKAALAVIAMQCIPFPDFNEPRETVRPLNIPNIVRQEPINPPIMPDDVYAPRPAAQNSSSETTK